MSRCWYSGMWLIILISCVICAFGLLSVLSNERFSRLQEMEHERRLAEQKAQASDDPSDSSTIAREEPIPVR